jgi:hypothetical protein
VTSVTTEAQTYHVQRTELVWQWHMDFPLLMSQAEGVTTCYVHTRLVVHTVLSRK